MITVFIRLCRHLTTIMVLLMVMLAVHGKCYAQSPPDTLVLDLDLALALAMNQSPEAVLAEMSLEESEWLWRSNRARDLPQVDLSMTIPSFNESLEERFDYIEDDSTGETFERRRYVRTQNTLWRGALSITQGLPTGGEIQLESNFYRRFFASDLLLEDQEEYSQNWRLSFEQELLNGNLRRAAIKRARVTLNRARWSHSREMRQLGFQVLQQFYTLLMMQREIEIAHDDLVASRATAALARRKFEAGLIPEVEALELEVDVIQKEAELESQLASFETSLDQYRILLGLDISLGVKLTGEPVFAESEIDLQQSISLALEHREEILEAEAGVETAEYDLDDARREYRPSGRLTAFYDFDRIDEEWSSSFSTDFEEFGENRGLFFTVSVPLWTGGQRRADVQQAVLSVRRSRIEREEQEKEIILEVREVVRNVNEAQRRYQNTLRSLDLAEQSYAMTQDRFENGQVTAREWMEAQITLKRNRINALRALIDHTVALARYRLTIGEPVV